MQSEKQLLPKYNSDGVQSTVSVCQIPQPKGCLKEGEEGSVAICAAFPVSWRNRGVLQEWRHVHGLRCTLSTGITIQHEMGAARSGGSRQIYQNVFIFRTFQGFASHLYGSGRSSGKRYQAVLHMFWFFLFYVSSMRETATKFLSFLDQCFVKLWQLSMTESQVTSAADHKTESDLRCLVIFNTFFFYMTHSIHVYVFHCSFKYN